MLRRETGRLGRQIEVLWTAGTLTGCTDVQLLKQFTQTRDASGELAFGELLYRHGPMVWGVCRQILPQSHDAADAFQATFLVLVRKARSIRADESLGPWLYRVAYRTAHRARTAALRNRSAAADEGVEEIAAASDETYTFDVRPLLYEELERLPHKYQAPIVLCHLEGKTHEQAARLLNWPVGTVAGRLSRGRRLLRARLERRGVTVASSFFCAGWLAGSHSVATTALADATRTVAAQFLAGQAISATVLSLTRGVLTTMIVRKLTTVTAAVLLVGAITGGAGAYVHQKAAPAGPPAVSSQKADGAPSSKPGPTPSSEPRAADGSGSMLAENCPADCPLTESGDGKFHCPIAMAGHALSRIFNHRQEHTVSSK